MNGREIARMDSITPLFTEEQIAERVSALAAEISADYAGCEKLHIICVLKGSTLFTSDLLRRITVPTELHFVRICSYAGTQSTGVLRIQYSDVPDLRDQHALIVEDIIDTGRTLHLLTVLYKEKAPASLRVCTLLDKPSRRVVQLTPEYIGFTIPDRFVIGYGMDYDEAYRGLPYIGELHS